MTFRLSKKVNEHVYVEGNLFSKRYDVFDGDELMGQFFYSEKKCFFTCGDSKIKLNIRTRFFAHPKVSIIEEATGETIGKYKLTDWVTIRGYADRLSIHDISYRFKQLTPDIRSSIFNRDSWGHYKFRLFNEGEEVIYYFKIDYPKMIFGNRSPKMPFEGSIEYYGSNKLLFFAGLYLVERAMENESVD